MTTAQKLFVLVVAYLLLSGNVAIPGAGGRVTAVTYFHERDTPVPSGVRAALDEMNHREPPIMATAHEIEATTPEQYAVSQPAAQKAGLPAIVSSAGKTVKRVVREPKTKEEALSCLR